MSWRTTLKWRYNGMFNNIDILRSASKGDYKWMPAGIQKITSLEFVMVPEGTNKFIQGAHILVIGRNAGGKAESSFTAGQMAKLGTVLSQLKANDSNKIIDWIGTAKAGDSEVFDIKPGAEMMIFQALNPSKDALGREYHASNLVHQDEEKRNKNKINTDIGLV